MATELVLCSESGAPHPTHGDDGACGHVSCSLSLSVFVDEGAFISIRPLTNDGSHSSNMPHHFSLSTATTIVPKGLRGIVTEHDKRRDTRSIAFVRVMQAQASVCLLLVHGHSNRLLYSALPPPGGQSPVLVIGQSRDCITCIALHPTLSLVVVGSLDGMAYAWIVADKYAVTLNAEGGVAVHAHSAAVTAVTCGDECFVTAGLDSRIRIFSLDDGTPMHTMTTCDKPFTALSCSPGFLFAGACDGAVWLWELPSLSLRAVIEDDAEQSSITDVCFSSLHNVFVVGSASGFLRLYSSASLNLLHARRISNDASSSNGESRPKVLSVNVAQQPSQGPAVAALGNNPSLIVALSPPFVSASSLAAVGAAAAATASASAAVAAGPLASSQPTSNPSFLPIPVTLVSSAQTVALNGSLSHQQQLQQRQQHAHHSYQPDSSDDECPRPRPVPSPTTHTAHAPFSRAGTAQSQSSSAAAGAPSVKPPSFPAPPRSASTVSVTSGFSGVSSVPHAAEPSLHATPAAAAFTRSLRPAFDNPSQANFGDPNRLAAHLAQASLSAMGANPPPSASALPHGPNSTLLLRQQLKELQNDVRTVAASKIAERERIVFGTSAAAAIPTYKSQDSVYSGLVPVELPQARVQKKRVVPPQITPEYTESLRNAPSLMSLLPPAFACERAGVLPVPLSCVHAQVLHNHDRSKAPGEGVGVSSMQLTSWMLA